MLDNVSNVDMLYLALSNKVDKNVQISELTGSSSSKTEIYAYTKK